MAVQNVPSTRTPTAARRSQRRWLLLGVGLAPLAYTLFVRLNGTVDPAIAAPVEQGNLLVLALPAFLAGLLSFLSPCTLPILPTYFAFTFQARRERIVPMTIAFFLGLATTMVILGATASVLSQLLFQNLRHVTLAGGMIVIGFGVMTMLGKGFSGFNVLDRPTASITGSYIYGATFALGWTACVGPILGALLTMLATQGAAVLQGAALAFLYALGLGTPLIVSASLFSRVGSDSRVWRLMRGRGFSFQVGAVSLHLHTTSVASGVLLIVVGVLLATGQLAMFSQWAVQTEFSQWVLDLEERMRIMLLGR